MQAARRSQIILMCRLAEAGISSRPYFTPIHLQPYYRRKFGYRRGDFPNTEFLGDIFPGAAVFGVMTEEPGRVCVSDAPIGR